MRQRVDSSGAGPSDPQYCYMCETWETTSWHFWPPRAVATPASRSTTASALPAGLPWPTAAWTSSCTASAAEVRVAHARTMMRADQTGARVIVTGAPLLGCSWGRSGRHISRQRVIPFTQEEKALLLCSLLLGFGLGAWPHEMASSHAQTRL
jgi:hypothetical protein